MSTLAVTLLRFGFLALLWLFVFFAIATIRRDVFGTRVTQRSAVSRRSANSRSALPATPSATPAGAGAALNTIVVTAGPLTGTQLTLTANPLLVGRSPDSSLVLDDGYASSRHARFYRSGHQVIVEDLDSTNGTWVGETRIHEPTILPAGVPVTIGKTVLELR